MTGTEHGFLGESDKTFPPMIIVDITNVCDLSCIHCAHQVIKKDPEYKPKYMDIGIFKRIVEEISKHKILLMRIVSDGESLFHPQFFEMMSTIKNAGIKPVNLTTNGMLLTPEINREIIESGLDVIDISIDAHREETYKSIRIGGDFKIVKNNVIDLLRLRDEKKSPIKVFVSILRQPLNEKEVDSFVEYWETKVDFVLVRNLCNMVGLVETKKDRKQQVLPKRYPCSQFWKRVTINHNGDIRYCVEDWRNKTVIANVIDKSIKDIWQGPEYEKLRGLHLSGQYEKVKLCSECTDWIASPWDYGYDKIIKKTIYNGRPGLI